MSALYRKLIQVQRATFNMAETSDEKKNGKPASQGPKMSACQERGKDKLRDEEKSGGSNIQ